MISRVLEDSVPDLLRDTLVALTPGLFQLLAGWMILG